MRTSGFYGSLGYVTIVVMKKSGRRLVLLWYAFHFVFQGAQACGYGLVVLTIVSGGVKRYRSGEQGDTGSEENSSPKDEYK